MKVKRLSVAAAMLFAALALGSQRAAGQDCWYCDNAESYWLQNPGGSYGWYSAWECYSTMDSEGTYDNCYTAPWQWVYDPGVGLYGLLTQCTEENPSESCHGGEDPFELASLGANGRIAGMATEARINLGGADQRVCGGFLVARAYGHKEIRILRERTRRISI